MRRGARRSSRSHPGTHFREQSRRYPRFPCTDSSSRRSSPPFALALGRDRRGIGKEGLLATVAGLIFPSVLAKARRRFHKRLAVPECEVLPSAIAGSVSRSPCLGNL